MSSLIKINIAGNHKLVKQLEQIMTLNSHIRSRDQAQVIAVRSSYN
ncbi:MAG: hypothetical protein ACP5LX_06380 [Nitrososphaeria archaeon]